MRPELGELTLWGALLLPAMYIVSHGVRRVNAWSGRSGHRRQSRQENVGFLMIFYSVVGALVGSLCQPTWSRSRACTHDPRGVLSCLFDDVAAPALERATEPLRSPLTAPERPQDEPSERASEPAPAPERQIEHQTTSERRPPSGNP
jgi:hypothetical protein